MKQKNIKEAIYEQFLELYNKIGKVISFNREWHTGLGDINGVVDSETRRIIMVQGEYAKTTDNYGRKIILVGSHFGTIAIYPESFGISGEKIPELAFYVCACANHAIGHYFNRIRMQRGLVKDAPMLYLLDPVKFTEFMDNLKAYAIKHSITVGDGMKRFTKEKKKGASAEKQFPVRKGPKTAAVKKIESKATGVQKNKRPRNDIELAQRNAQLASAKPAAVVASKPKHLRESKRHPELARAA